MKKFDPTKPVQTRDGRPARIICTDRYESNGQFPIVALVNVGAYEQVSYHRTDGRTTNYPTPDLVNILKRKQVG